MWLTWNKGTKMLNVNSSLSALIVVYLKLHECIWWIWQLNVTTHEKIPVILKCCSLYIPCKLHILVSAPAKYLIFTYFRKSLVLRILRWNLTLFYLANNSAVVHKHLDIKNSHIWTVLTAFGAQRVPLSNTATNSLTVAGFRIKQDLVQWFFRPG